MTRPVSIVVGAGPGVSGSCACAWAAEGYDVGLVGLAPDVLAALTERIGAVDADAAVESRTADLTDVAATTAAIGELGERFGRVDVLHFNPSAFRQEDPLSLSVEHLLADVALGVGALLTTVQAARPFLVAGSRITVTGSMAADEPWHEAASLGVQKAAVRNLVHSIDTTLRDDGIRAVSVTVRGTLADEGPFHPDRVAEALVAAARRPEDDWATEVPYSG